MSYFDDKQEILKVELTTYGRYLISRGKFRPAYYAFFDDDVLYDGEYADVTETQNSIQTRILDETPSLKPQTTFTSIENSVKLSTLLPREIGKLKQEADQIGPDKNYALSYPLAKSSHGTEYAPAWNLRFINGVISGDIEQYINNASGTYEILQPFLKLPQINLIDSIYDIKKSLNDPTVEPNYAPIWGYSSGSDDYYYSMKDDIILIDAKELNVEEDLKNFDIEMFIEDEEVVAGTEEKRKILNKLNFKKDTIQILDGILLDEPLRYDVEEDTSYAEYFFDITIDDEIEPSYLQGAGAALRPPTAGDGLTRPPTGNTGPNPNPSNGNTNNNPPFGTDC
jgi:hypothetical protein